MPSASSRRPDYNPQVERRASHDETMAGVSSADVTARSSAEVRPLGEGQTIGRYIVVSLLGAGGMGVVHAAYDPELDRKIALKLIRGGGEGGDEAQLLREAQALAKLSHPNVVTVHDVGTHEGRVWLAMELVVGRTLAAWLDQRTRSWAEILQVLVAAGRGLAAAHTAGLVHRDFKPDNVMIGDDGGVRVMDFGLARPSEPLDSRTAEGGLATESHASHSRTRAGAIVGTPAYMAPEQLGGVASAAADQFSYAVTLWEALFGERPFVGSTIAELTGALLRGEIRDPQRPSAAPAWLRRALRRGLALDPAARWPSIVALLDAIESGRARTRRRRVMLGAAAIAALGTAAFAATRIDRARTIRACDLEATAIADVWNATKNEQVRASFAAAGTGYAATGAAKLGAALDRWALQWSQTRAEVCHAGLVDVTMAEGIHGAATACLDERAAEVAALVHLAENADREIVLHASAAAARLASPSECADAGWLAERPVPAPGSEHEVAALRQRLEEAAALRWAGRPHDGLELARSISAGARSLGWPPLEAEALLLEGTLMQESGAYEESIAVVESALFVAAKADQNLLAARAAVQLTFVTGSLLKRPADALRWGRLGDLLLSKSGEVDGLGAASLAHAIGGVHQVRGAFREAISSRTRALELYERALGPGHLELTVPLSGLGVGHVSLGEYAIARVYFARVHDLRAEVLGDDHPSLAAALNSLGGVDAALGDTATALREYERSLELRLRVHGPDHPDVAISLNNLGNMYRDLGQFERSIEHLERAIPVLVRVYGEDHVNVGMALANVGATYSRMERYPQAREQLERALTIHERSVGLQHPNVGTILANLGNVHFALGAHAVALAHFERAISIFDDTVSAGHLDLAIALQGAGDSLAELGRHREAVVVLERGLALRSTPDVEPFDRATTEAALARALWATGTDRPHALALAHAALDHLDSGETADAKLIAEISAWLGTVTER